MADLSGLVDALRDSGLGIEPELDGALHRSGAEWFIGFEEGDSAWCKFGDWSRGVSEVWSTGDTTFVAARSAEARAKLEAQWNEVRKNVALLWSDLQPIGEHPYLTRKGLFELFGAKVQGEQLLVPLVDASNKLWSLHKIAADGTKSFETGGRVEGCFHVMGVLQGAERVYVVEGFATGASVYVALAKEFPVVCAMTAGNLHSVCVSLRETHGPGLEIVVAADNDAWGADNPGLRLARQAALAVGGRVIYPRFSEEAGSPTDWNDLHAREGLDSVRRQLADGLLQGKSLIPLEGDKPGKPPTEEQVVQAMLFHLGDDVLVYGDSVFLYHTNHWRECDLEGIRALRHKCSILYGPNGTYRKAEDAFKKFKVKAVGAKRNPFEQHPNCANFQNGTLWLDRDPNSRRYSLRFKPHDRDDLITHVLPYDYKEDWSERNTEFDAMLERVFAGDADKEQKILALSQMFGACLLQAFPHIFFLYGKAKSGKSTVIQLAMHLVSKENACSVEPTDFDGFNMESMVGKLVNFDTDITLDKPIKDSTVKKIIDRVPARIRRKGIKDVYAPLPPIHIFGGNGLPKSLDGASQAYARRVTILEFKNEMGGGKTVRDYPQYVYECGVRGLLNFALHGLKSLCESGGQFAVPTSGSKALELWQEESDPVGKFYREVREQGAGSENCFVVLKDGAEIAKQSVFDAFKFWHKEEYGREPWVGRTSFYRRLGQLGVGEAHYTGGPRKFNGLGLGDPSHARF